MKTVKSILAGTVGTVALFVGAPMANAAVALPTSSIDPLSCNAWNTSCVGGYNYILNIGNNDFTKRVTFTIPGAGTVGGSVTTEFRTSSQDIDFSSIILDGLHAFSHDDFDPDPERWSISIPGLAGGAHYIDFAGHANGLSSFSGTVSFAVPEPSTWAMLILGFGMIGAAMRRRQRQTVRYSFA